MKKSILLLAGLAAVASTASAQIVFNSANAAQGAYQTDATVASGYTPTSGTNSVLLMGVAVDGSLSSAAATFGGNAMTLIASNTRTAIFGYVLPDTTAGDIVLTTGVNNAETIITYGTLTGVDTSTFGSLVTANGAASVDGVTQTITGNDLIGLNNNDYVFSVLSQNSMYNASGVTPSSPLATVRFFSGTGGGSYTGVIAGGTLASAGDYTPSFDFENASGFPGNTGLSFFSSVAFTAAIPEPSTYAAIGGLMALGLVMWRRNRRG